MPSRARLFNKFCTAGTNECLDLSLFWEYLRNHLKDHATYGQGAGIHGKPMSVAPSQESLAGWMLKSMDKWSIEWWSGTQASSNYMQGVIQDTVYEESVSAVTSDYCAVLSC